MSRPVRPKVKAQAGGGTVGGAVAVLAVWALGGLGFDVPPEPATAIGVLSTASLGLLAGYLRRER